jgi:hypothetical protein
VSLSAKARSARVHDEDEHLRAFASRGLGGGQHRRDDRLHAQADQVGFLRGGGELRGGRADDRDLHAVELAQHVGREQGLAAQHLHVGRDDGEGRFLDARAQGAERIFAG